MRVVVVGAGVGGLACAIRLAHGGHRVTVLEATGAVGGKCGRIARDGFVFDTGPSLLTMPWVFERLFSETGAPLEEEIDLVRVEPVTRYRFADGSAVELSADLPRTVAALEDWSPGAGEDWLAFMGTCAAMWRASWPVLAGPSPWPPRRPRPGDPPPDPRSLVAVKPWWTLRQLARAHARDPRLRMVIERFATYAGADPRRAPAALALAGYVEHAFGAWHPRGGLGELVRALARRLEDLGGRVLLERPARRVTLGRRGPVAVETDAGPVPADAVVLNGDADRMAADLLGRPRPAHERSLSGLALMLGLRGDDPDPVHHEIRFPADYDAEFDDVFRARRPVRDPTVYVCAPTATDPSVAPPGHASWFVLVNAPAIGDAADWDAAEQALIDRLGVAGRIAVRARRTPGDLERLTGSPGGAIYGRAPHGRLGTLRRPPTTLLGVPGVWFAGGTVHPGGGLPMVTLGGTRAAAEIGPASPRA